MTTETLHHDVPRSTRIGMGIGSVVETAAMTTGIRVNGWLERLASTPPVRAYRRRRFEATYGTDAARSAAYTHVNRTFEAMFRYSVPADRVHVMSGEHSRIILASEDDRVIIVDELEQGSYMCSIYGLKSPDGTRSEARFYSNPDPDGLIRVHRVTRGKDQLLEALRQVPTRPLDATCGSTRPEPFSGAALHPSEAEVLCGQLAQFRPL